jgi:heterodisulfide reductase subunit A
VRLRDAVPLILSLEKKDKMLSVGLYHPGLRKKIELDADVAILSTPVIQQEDAKTVSQMLKVPLGQDGFFFEAHVKLSPVDFATDGIYMAGFCRGPANINECVTQATAAAARAAIPMARGYVKTEPYIPVVDQEKCEGCGVCIEVCPYGAMQITKKDGRKVAENIAAACKGCGACGSSCVHKAINMGHFTDEQILAQIDEVVS